jgi:hypothetical protein
MRRRSWLSLPCEESEKIEASVFLLGKGGGVLRTFFRFPSFRLLPHILPSPSYSKMSSVASAASAASASSVVAVAAPAPLRFLTQSRSYINQIRRRQRRDSHDAHEFYDWYAEDDSASDYSDEEEHAECFPDDEPTPAAS